MDAILAAVNASPPTGVPQTSDGRFEPFQASELPSIVLFEVREENEPQKAGRWSPLLQRSFTARFEVRVDSVPARTAADPIIAWLGQTLGGSQLGGLAEQVYEQLSEWQRIAEDFPHTLISIDFRVDYTSLMSDPTTRTQS
jgi:hypothetical protein